eukprot:scpid104627/ scgid17612/ 
MEGTSIGMLYGEVTSSAEMICKEITSSAEMNCMEITPSAEMISMEITSSAEMLCKEITSSLDRLSIKCQQHWRSDALAGLQLKRICRLMQNISLHKANLQTHHHVMKLYPSPFFKT